MGGCNLLKDWKNPHKICNWEPENKKIYKDKVARELKETSITSKFVEFDSYNLL